MSRPQPLMYLRQQFGATFTKEWMDLSEKDKAELRAYAEAEMDALGM